MTTRTELDDLTPGSVQYIEHDRPSRAQLAQERETDTAYCRALAGTMPGCAPWCTYHAYVEGWSEFPGICWSDEPDGPDGDGRRVLMTDEHGPYARHLVHWDGTEGATVEQAEEFARKILALVELARKDGAA